MYHNTKENTRAFSASSYGAWKGNGCFSVLTEHVRLVFVRKKTYTEKRNITQRMVLIGLNEGLPHSEGQQEGRLWRNNYMN